MQSDVLLSVKQYSYFHGYVLTFRKSCWQAWHPHGANGSVEKNILRVVSTMTLLIDCVKQLCCSKQSFLFFTQTSPWIPVDLRTGWSNIGSKHAIDRTVGRKHVALNTAFAPTKAAFEHWFAVWISYLTVANYDLNLVHRWPRAPAALGSGLSLLVMKVTSGSGLSTGRHTLTLNPFCDATAITLLFSDPTNSFLGTLLLPI